MDQIGIVFHSVDLVLLALCQPKKIVAVGCALDDENNVMDDNDDALVLIGYGRRYWCANDADHGYVFDRYLLELH